MLSHPPETGDSEFTWGSFISCNNNSLLKNFGNSLNRVLKFVNSQYYNNTVPNWTKYHEASYDTWKEIVNRLLAQYIEELDAVKLRFTSATILQVSQARNSLLQSNKLDNHLVVNEPSKCAAVVGLTVTLIHLLAALVYPYMPEILWLSPIIGTQIPSSLVMKLAKQSTYLAALNKKESRGMAEVVWQRGRVQL